MKKVALLFSALALVLGLSQCKKVRPDMPHYSGPVGDKYIQEVKLTAAYPKGNSKVSVEDDATSLLKLKWEIDDELTVGGTGAGSKNLKCTSVSEDGLTGTFTGVITASEGTVTFTYGSTPTPESYTGQVGTLEGLKNLVCLEGSATFNQDGNYNDVPMKLPYAILKLDLSALGSAEGNDVSITGASTDIELTGVTYAANNPYYVAIPATGTEIEYTFSGNGITVKRPWKLDPNTYYTNKNDVGSAIEIAPEKVCFEAISAGSEVGFDSFPADMVYSTDGIEWTDLTEKVTLTNVGDKCYIRTNVPRDNIKGTSIFNIFTPAIRTP